LASASRASGTAFEECINLTSIKILGSVTSIGFGGFYGCSIPTDITFPHSLIKIGGYAFSGCTSLSSIEIPNAITNLGDGAFYYCSKATSVTIPNNVAVIGREIFAYCFGLTKITIEDRVSSIGDEAFIDCTNLTSVAIPDSVTNVGNATFCLCSSLTNILIGRGVISIGYSGFLLHHCHGVDHKRGVAAGPAASASHGIFTCSGLFRLVFTESKEQKAEGCVSVNVESSGNRPLMKNRNLDRRDNVA